MPKSKRAFLLALGAIVLAGCGGKARAETSGTAKLIVTPAARENSALSPPPTFPGRSLRFFTTRSSELVKSSARVLLESSDGSVELIGGRSHSGRLCVGAVSPLSGESTVRCLAAGERPPVIGFIAMTGRRGIGVDSSSVVGLADPSTAGVALELQDLSRKTVQLRRLPGLPWLAFSTGPYKNMAANSGDFVGLPSALIALGSDGQETDRVDLAFGYPHCQPGLCRHKQTRTGIWVIIRDAIASQQYAKISAALERRANQLLLSNARVKQIVSGRQFSLGPLGYWQKCNGKMIGVHADLQLAYPISIKGVLPYTSYENGTGHAYLEGRAFFDVQNVRKIDIGIDLNRNRVVSIDAGFGDDVVFRGMRQIGKPHPAGGPDTADCGSNSD